jgi:hypothetical protein
MPAKSCPYSRQHRKKNKSDESREHENVAMREIHHSKHARNHRIADHNEAVDGTERDPVDQLPQKDRRGMSFMIMHGMRKQFCLSGNRGGNRFDE